MKPQVPTNNIIEVKRATAEDRELLTQMYLELLKFLEQFEHDILPTRKNAEWIINNVMMAAIGRGDPVLIAWDGEKPIGAIFWVVQHLPFDVRWSSALGYGTYIDKDYRHKKIGSLLRGQGLKILKEMGIEKLIGMPHLKNEVSLKASEKLGWVPYMRYDLLDIK